MSEANSGGQYKALGRRLKALRSKANESLAEASGAVEIDVQELASFELGNKRPTEDVLLLLISHFGAQDDEAVHLWEMAGYETVGHPTTPASAQPDANNAQPPILFTDIVDVAVNNFGVVMNFMQGGGPNSKPIYVAKVGMSREHAKSVLEILQVTLGQVEQQQKIQKQQSDKSTK